MKKTKIKMLTTAACLALIGSASAAWVYSGTATASANIGVKVAAYASAGTITISDTSKIKIVLDNGSVYYSVDGVNSETATIDVTYEVPTGVDTTTKTAALTYDMNLSGGLGTYIQFTDSSSVSLSDQTWVSGTFTLPKLSWKTNMCPTNFEGYKSLLADSTGVTESSTAILDAPSEWGLFLEFNAKVD